MDIISFLEHCDAYPRNYVVKHQILGYPGGLPVYFRWKSDAAIYRDYLNELYGEATAWIEDVKEEN